VKRSITAQQSELDDAASVATSDSLQHLAVTLTELLRETATQTFPITGASPLRSMDVLELHRQRSCLSRLLAQAQCVVSAAARAGAIPGDCFVRNPEWRRQFAHCQRQHPSLQWQCCAWYGGNPHGWMRETRAMLNRVRHSIRKEQQRMLRAPPTPLNESSAALVHRMLKSDALPSHLQSVVNGRGELTSSAEELESVMVDHFRNVFAMPPADPAPLPHPPPAMLFDKSSVKGEWFDGLMAPVAEHEITDALADAQLVSSPGEDGVSTGLWKLALIGCEELRTLVQSLFTGCLAHSFFPSAWKTSVIVPLVKDFFFFILNCDGNKIPQD